MDRLVEIHVITYQLTYYVHGTVTLHQTLIIRLSMRQNFLKYCMKNVPFHDKIFSYLDIIKFVNFLDFCSEYFIIFLYCTYVLFAAFFILWWWQSILFRPWPTLFYSGLDLPYSFQALTYRNLFRPWPTVFSSDLDLPYCVQALTYRILFRPWSYHILFRPWPTVFCSDPDLLYSFQTLTYHFLFRPWPTVFYSQALTYCEVKSIKAAKLTEIVSCLSNPDLLEVFQNLLINVFRWYLKAFPTVNFVY